ncbi:MAG: DUF4041 domain-containing protein [Fusobacteriaceae bacterium]
MIITIAIILTLIFFILILFIKLKKELEANKIFKEKYSNLINEEEMLEKKKTELFEVTKKFEDEKNNMLRILETKKILETSLKEVEEVLEFQEYSFYKKSFSYESSVEYKNKLDTVYENQKEMIKNKSAAVCTIEWTVDGSKVKGKKMTNDNLKLILRAFNGESDAAIAKVKHNNFSVMEKRIIKSKEAIDKLSAVNKCCINDKYYKLKLEELHLNYEYALKLQEEKEEQREIKEQMREEERARRDYEKAIKEAELEEKNYTLALENTKKEYEEIMAQKSEEERIIYTEKIAKLEEQLEIAHNKSQRAISQAQLTRSGHVYIISNIGSFGEEIYKIGMTRRLEPQDRVKELGGASVPFPFDIHAMIYSEDAPTLETKIHRAFNDKRVNLINQRREFFNISLDEIKNFIEENHGEFKLTKIAEANEFRQTISMKKEHVTPEFDSNEELLGEIEENFNDLTDRTI